MSGPSVDEHLVQERIRREILSRADRIPPLPDIVVQILALLNNSKSEPEDLERHLMYDQVLVGKLLGMVNSSFFGLNREIVAVRDAIMILGSRGLRNLLLTATAATYLERDYACYGHSEKGLWTHSLAVATGAATLAEITNQSSDLRDEVFLAGLLHDIGKLPLAPYLKESKAPWSRDPDEAPGIEREAVEIDHTEAGALVCAKWNIAASVQEIIKHHHDQESLRQHRVPCAIVRLADDLANQRGIGYRPGEAPIPRLLAQDWELLELDSGSWRSAYKPIEQAVDDALANFSSICG